LKEVRVMNITVLEQRAPNFALPKLKKCMNCGRPIGFGKGLYESRFCSVDCKELFCSAIKTI
jgi:hypothetical protein